jgi:hypothetical protein
MMVVDVAGLNRENPLLVWGKRSKDSAAACMRTNDAR